MSILKYKIIIAVFLNIFLLIIGIIFHKIGDSICKYLEFFFNFALGSNQERKDLEYITGPYILHQVWQIIKWFFVYFVLIYNIFISNFFGSLVIIPTSSMTPTICTNEFVLYSAISYGPLKKYIDMNILEKIYYKCIQSNTIQRGDVVSFEVSEQVFGFVFVKRIIGLPGDTVKLINGIVFINNQPCDLEYNDIYHIVENDSVSDVFLYEETLPNGCKHKIICASDDGTNSADTTVEFKIPEGKYLGIGDNRNNSADSRVLVGFIDQNDIRGKAFMILFSNSNLRNVSLYKFMTGIRFDRSGQIIR